MKLTVQLLLHIFTLILSSFLIKQHKCDWIKDITTENGLQIAEGLNVKINTNLNTNNSNPNLYSKDIIGKYGLEVDYQSLGVSVRKIPNKDVLKIGLYYKDKEQGRSKKMGEALFPIVMGFKITGLLGITLIGSTIFVAKALLLSKLAVMLGLGLMISNYLHKDNQYERVELDHNPYNFNSYEYPSGSGYVGGGENIGDGTDYTGYANYGVYGYSTTGQVQEQQQQQQSAESSSSFSQSQYYSPSAPSNGSSFSQGDSSLASSSSGTGLPSSSSGVSLSASSSSNSQFSPSSAAANKRRDSSSLRRKVQLIPTYITVFTNIFHDEEFIASGVSSRFGSRRSIIGSPEDGRKV